MTARNFSSDHENDRPIENAKVLPPANYHGGDWRGIKQKIKEGYFKNLGVNTI